MQNVSRASSAQAVSSHVTVRVEGHVTPGLESAAGDVLQAFMEINVSWVRRKAASIHRFRFRQLCLSTERQLTQSTHTRPQKLDSTAHSCGLNFYNKDSLWIHSL